VVPDHTTIARFRQRHQDALGGLLGDVPTLCAEAGLAGVEVLSRTSTGACPKIPAILEDAEHEIFAFYAFPPSHPTSSASSPTTAA
jgi:hypothetical protein